jgi:hypothetical protein
MDQFTTLFHSTGCVRLTSTDQISQRLQHKHNQRVEESSYVVVHNNLCKIELTYRRSLTLSGLVDDTVLIGYRITVNTYEIDS